MSDHLYIGITERGECTLDHNWFDWVKSKKPAILITKNPAKLYDVLVKNFDISDINIIVHSTITGYGGTVYEPNVSNMMTSIEGYGKLIDLLSPHRVVLRIDPIIPTENGFKVAKMVLETARLEVGMIRETRVRISFLDNYKHVKKRFKDAGLPELPYDFHGSLSVRKSIWKLLGGEKIEICCEPDMKNTPCISDIDCRIFGVESLDPNGFQRPLCGCLGNKFELLSVKKQCPNKCIYCYWK